MFKGTTRYPKGSVDRMIARVGGTFNAMTWLDYTAYYATLPAEHIGIALDIESDRMVNTLFDPAETEAERTVIIEERRMYENQPSFRLAQEIQATAFEVHPYRHETIGWESDLRTMTREDLAAHYRHYYAPNNATIVAVGDFDTNEMVAQIETFFGSIAPSDTPPPPSAVEPTQQGERRVAVHGREPTRRMTFAYKGPAVTDEDYWACLMMDAILTGPKLGGGGTARTSRLYKRLVDGEIVLSVGSGVSTTINPYLYSISAALLPTSDPATVEAEIEAEIALLQENLVDESELARLKKQLRARWAMGMESMSGQGRSIGLAATVATLEWFTHYLDNVEAVTPEQVRAAAQKYLRPQQRTVGWYTPES